MLGKNINKLLTFLTICSIAFAQVGDKCVLKTNGQNGECKISSDCPVVETQAKRGVSPTLCGFYQLTTPIVCCPDNNFGPQANENSFLTESEDEFQDKPVTESNSKLRISEQKCEEYSRVVTNVVHVTGLVANAKPISLSFAKCDYNSVPLIVGGTNASVGEFPFMAAIGFNSDDEKWRCGGTLISNRYVLTAAHCTFSLAAGGPVVVRLGDLDLSSSNDGSIHMDYEVANFTVHPNYKFPEKYYDIALLRTKKEISFTNYIRPACLYIKQNIEQNLSVATGWGKLDFTGKRSDILMKVPLNIYANSLCSRTYQNQKNNELPRGIISNMLCAGELEGGHDTCEGDSGGPLLVTKAGNKCQFYVIGVTSFGKPCGQINSPAVYTRVSDFVPWIEKTIW